MTLNKLQLFAENTSVTLIVIVCILFIAGWLEERFKKEKEETVAVEVADKDEPGPKGKK